MAVMTLKEFRATRRTCLDIGAEIGADFYGADDVRKAEGYMYAGSAYIERLNGGFFLQILRDEWQEEFIEPLEALLYEWCVSETDLELPPVKIWSCLDHKKFNGPAVFTEYERDGLWEIGDNDNSCPDVPADMAMAVLHALLCTDGAQRPIVQFANLGVNDEEEEANDPSAQHRTSL